MKRTIMVLSILAVLMTGCASTFSAQSKVAQANAIVVKEGGQGIVVLDLSGTNNSRHDQAMVAMLKTGLVDDMPTRQLLMLLKHVEKKTIVVYGDNDAIVVVRIKSAFAQLDDEMLVKKTVFRKIIFIGDARYESELRQPVEAAGMHFELVNSD